MIEFLQSYRGICKIEMEVGHMRRIKAVCMSESLTIAMKGNEQS